MPYNASLTECEWRSTARKTDIRNTIVRQTRSQPTHDMGRYIQPHGSNQINFINGARIEYRESALAEDEVKTTGFQNPCGRTRADALTPQLHWEQATSLGTGQMMPYCTGKTWLH
jgi:hypothetical protein